MKKVHWFEVVLILMILFSHGNAATSSKRSLMNWFQTDDAFYYFKTANNISNGLGVTFDGINPTNGFHPLWMLVCIPIFSLANLNLYLPFRILIILMGVLNAGTSLIIYRWLSKILSNNAGMLGAIAWAFSTSIHSLTSESGIETGLSVFFLFLLIRLISDLSVSTTKIPTKKLIFTGLIAAMAFLSRLDNIFILLLLGIWLVFAKTTICHFLVLDSLFIILSAYLSLLIRLGNFVDIYTFSSGVFIFIAIGLIIKIPIYYFYDLYHPTNEPSIVNLLRKSFLAVTIGEVVTAIPVLMLTFAKKGFSFPKSLPAIDFVITIFLVLGSRQLIYLISEKHPGNIQTPLKILKQNWKSWFRTGVIYFGILFGSLAAYALYNLGFSKTPFPVSGQIKQWWGTMYTIYGVPENNLLEALGVGPKKWSLLSSTLSYPARFIPPGFIFLFNLLIIIIIVYLVIINRKEIKNSFNNLLLLPILGGSFWQIWTYNIRSYVGFRNWYWVTQLIFSFLCLILLYHILIIPSRKPVFRDLIRFASLVFIGLAIFTGYASHMVGLVNYNYSGLDENNYMFAVSFLESNTEPGAIIGLTGGGSTAYFINDRTIVNLDGLINSYSYFQALKNYKAGEFLDNMGLDYVFAKPFIIMKSDPYQFEFPDRLKLISYFDTYALYQFQHAP